MCSLLDEYPQLRRKSDANSTPPTRSARPLWSSQMLASVAPERFHAHLQCHPEGRDVPPTLAIPTTAANPTPRPRRPLTPHTPSGTARCWPAWHQSVSTPIFNVIPRAETCPLPKHNPQLRLDSDAQSTPLTRAGQRSTRAFPRPFSMSSRRPRCAPSLRSTSTPRSRHQEHAAHPLRTPRLEQPNPGQRSTRACPRPSSISSRGPKCARYLRTTHNYAAYLILRARRPPTSHTPSRLPKGQLA